MGRLVLPLETAERMEWERLSKECGLSIPTLLALQRRGFHVVRALEAGTRL